MSVLYSRRYVNNMLRQSRRATLGAWAKQSGIAPYFADPLDRTERKRGTSCKQQEG